MNQAKPKGKMKKKPEERREIGSLGADEMQLENPEITGKRRRWRARTWNENETERGALAWAGKSQMHEDEVAAKGQTSAPKMASFPLNEMARFGC